MIACRHVTRQNSMAGHFHKKRERPAPEIQLKQKLSAVF
jgi:hypothetical protein